MSAITPLHILVVDDEPSVLEVVSESLREDGHIVQTAIDGEDGWQQFEKATWDVVLTDRVMPRMTGDQLAVAIRRVSPHMPIVMVTGVIDSRSAIEMKKAGVDVIVRKPFTFAILRKAIEEARNIHLAGHQMG